MMNELIEYLKANYKYLYFGKDTSLWKNYRQYKQVLVPSPETVKEFNRIFFPLRDSDWPMLSRTDENYISRNRKSFRQKGWDIQVDTLYFELIVIYLGKMWIIHFEEPRGREKEEGNISGSTAFRYFVRELEKFGVNISKMAITNGMEVKKDIEHPLIDLYRDNIAGRTFYNAHHIDFHSSHPAGMAKYYSELRPAIENIYKTKEASAKDSFEYNKCKAILNRTWGYLQSKWVGAKWAHIARDAIHDTNERLVELSNRLIASGRQVLAYNTDGIWYQGEIYHGEGEGPGLGQWGHDHVNCRIRFKSKGAYEFEENGNYKAVVRGYSTLDRIKPRENWVWGDIYRTEIYEYKFSMEKGVYIEWLHKKDINIT